MTIGAGAYVGSGSVVTGDVAEDALAIARGRQVVKAGWARAFREAQAGEENSEMTPDQRRHGRGSYLVGVPRPCRRDGDDVLGFCQNIARIGGPAMCGIVGILGREPVAPDIHGSAEAA